MVEENNDPGQLAKPEDDEADPDTSEIVEAFKELPPQERKMVSSLFARFTSGPAPSPISKHITPEHISKLIENDERDNERQFQAALVAEATKRWAMGAVLALVVIVLAYAGITKDKELSEKVITAGLAALGGFGVGYAVAKQSE